VKQEQKLVAETYRYLAPFIDTSCDFFLSLDGQAALIGVGRGQFLDGTLPDLWFTLVGRSSSMLIEAKALDSKGKVSLMQTQLKAWRTNGHGGHKPDHWIAASNAFDAFYLWSHSAFLPILDATVNRQDTVILSAPTGKKQFSTISELALAILRI
jgi:hypothetical protein